MEPEGVPPGVGPSTERDTGPSQGLLTALSDRNWALVEDIVAILSSQKHTEAETQKPTEVEVLVDLALQSCAKGTKLSDTLVKRGDVVQLLEGPVHSGWWWVEAAKGVQGYAAGVYLKLPEEPTEEPTDEQRQRDREAAESQRLLEEKTEQLMAFGFPKFKCRQALQATDGHVERAVEYVLNPDSVFEEEESTEEDEDEGADEDLRRAATGATGPPPPRGAPSAQARAAASRFSVSATDGKDRSAVELAFDCGAPQELIEALVTLEGSSKVGLMPRGSQLQQLQGACPHFNC